uniref:PARP-type domain-containing protein n=1 Tax=Sinocyclocheilus anshuiensis TaxID=1608454 RepID=A0A671MKD8_9TELE
MFDGKVPHWHHFSCFWLRAAVQSPSDISGFTDLRWGDQEKVKKAIESGDVHIPLPFVKEIMLF